MNDDIREFLDSIEDEERRLELERFQWRLDQELNKIKDPVARMNRMVELLYGQLHKFQTALTNPSSLVEDRSPPNNVTPLRKD